MGITLEQVRKLPQMIKMRINRNPATKDIGTFIKKYLLCYAARPSMRKTNPKSRMPSSTSSSNSPANTPSSVAKPLWTS